MDTVNGKAVSKPGYKQTAVGWLPVEWEVLTLKEVCVKIQDGNYGADYPKANEFLEVGIPFLTSKAIGDDGSLIEEKVDFIAHDKHNSLKKAQIQLNDVLFTNRGANVGAIGIVDNRIANGNIGPQLTLLRADERKMHYLFLKYVMKCHLLQNQIRSQDSGSAMNFFGIGETGKFKLPIPSVEEQKEIAGILLNWETAIFKTNYLIHLHQQRKKSLMQQLLTGKKRLPSFNGEWSEVTMGDLFERIKRTLEDESEVEAYTISSKFGFVTQHEKFNRVIAGSSLNNYTLIRKNEFSYNKGNSLTYPYGCIFKFEAEAGLIPFVYISFKAKSRINENFYKFYFEHGMLERQLKKIITSGARGDGLLNVNADDFFKLKMFMPSYEEQTAIANILLSTEQEIHLLKQKLDALKEQKKGLMQQLLTGKKRVKL